jgi:hypothetical protein
VSAGRIYLLSPASCGGVRAGYLFRDEARFDLAQRVRTTEGATIGEVFSFLSGLYFRGKLTYALHFAAAPPGVVGVNVITTCEGLRPAWERIGLDRLRRFAAIDLARAGEEYTTPLLSDAHALARAAGDTEIVLLGSVASAKYVEPLLEVFGDRLRFPAEFVGRGDMSRGGLMLRRVREGHPLTYVPARGASRHGVRPPKLVPQRRARP